MIIPRVENQNHEGVDTYQIFRAYTRRVKWTDRALNEEGQGEPQVL